MNELFKDKLIQLISSNPDYKIEFSYHLWETDFLRFFRSEVNYNISKQAVELTTRIYKDKKSIGFNITNPNIEQVEEKLQEAFLQIDKLPADPDFVDIENNLEKVPEINKPYNPEIVNLEKKVAILQTISDAVEKYNFRIYGTFICNFVTEYIVNSNGLDKRTQSSPIMLELKAVSDINMVTVLETYAGENFNNFDVEEFKSHLLKKVEIARKEIVDVEPGDYEVILAPRCIGEYLAYLTSSIEVSSLDRKDSYFEGKIGQQIFPENITLIDDPHNPKIIQRDYTSEGHIYHRVPIIEKGVFKAFIVDNYYGNKLGMEKNGTEGDCLVLESGDKSLEEMISTVKKGLYISSLHYMNFINAKETSLTGLTRDGTFLIEEGKLTKVVNNLRFTEKISDIVAHITEIENRLYTVPFSGNYEHFSISSYLMPHVKVNEFNISSSTKTI